MKYVAALLLAQLGGNDNPSAADLKKILESVGADVDSDALSKLVSSVEGKSIEDLLTEGSEKLATVPVGGSSGSASAGASGDAAQEEAKEEEEEESSEEMGLGLFG